MDEPIGRGRPGDAPGKPGVETPVPALETLGGSPGQGGPDPTLGPGTLTAPENQTAGFPSDFTPMDSDATPPPGWPLGWERYQCIRLLGSGGMGRVFEALDPSLRRRVAIKLLRSDDPELLQRFLREAQAQARVDHPDVCKVYEVGEAGGQPYIAMQLVRGRPLSAMSATLSGEQKALVVMQVAQALQAAHRLGLVHRDLKPGNIMVETNEDGSLHPFVVDFGLVRELGAESLTVDGTTVGTPAFMAPEQARGDVVDRRADVYSLGATLYSLLSGKPPFAGTTPMDLLVQVMTTEPAPLGRHVPGVARDLETIVMKCLEKDPSRRYDSARALAEDLRRFLDGEPIKARPASLVYRVGKRVRKNKLAVALGAAVLLATLVLGGLWLGERRDAARQAELAQHFGQQVERAEGLLWRAQSLEPHDIRSEREMVRRQLTAIESEMRQAGRVALGPGHAALGRGYQALQEHARAREHLEAAWQAGYRLPEVAYSFGLCLGELYQRELTALQRVLNPEEREKRKHEAELTLRDPALTHLRASAGASGTSAAYVHALLAFHEGRDSEAIDKAQLAFSRVPWLYEAKLLEGQAWLRIMRARQAKGDYPGGDEAFAAAATAIEKAARTGESDIRAHAGLCTLWRTRIVTDVWYLDRASQPTMDHALSACRQALVIDPDHAGVHNTLSEAYLSWTEHLGRRGLPAVATAHQAVEGGLAATRLQAGDDTLWRTLGLAYRALSTAEQQVGADPTEALRKGREASRRALAINPRNFFAASDLGLMSEDEASYRLDREEDPSPAVAEAEEAYTLALAILPGNLESLSTLGFAYWSQVAFLVWTADRDPAVPLARGIETLQKALQVNPRHPPANIALAMLRIAEAEWARRHAQDPAPPLAEAEQALRLAETLNPESFKISEAQCRMYLVAAAAAIDRGRTGDRELEAARLAFARTRQRMQGYQSPFFDRQLRELETRSTREVPPT